MTRAIVDRGLVAKGPVSGVRQLADLLPPLGRAYAQLAPACRVPDPAPGPGTSPPHFPSLVRHHRKPAAVIATTTTAVPNAPTLSDLRALDEAAMPSLFRLPPEVEELRDEVRDFAQTVVKPRTLANDLAPANAFDWEMVEASTTGWACCA